MQSGKTVAVSYSLQLTDEQTRSNKRGGREMLSNCFSLSAHHQEEISHFNKLLFFCWHQGEERVPCPQKRQQEPWPLMESIQSGSEQAFHLRSGIPSTPRPETAQAHTVKICFMLLALPGWEGAGAVPCPVQTHREQQIPSPCVTLSSTSQQKMNGWVYQLGFDTGWKDTLFFFYYFTWD